MAILNASMMNMEIVRSRINGRVCWAHIVFTIAGTYAQADGCRLQSIGTLISGNTRNARSVTLLDAAFGQSATIVTDGSEMGLKNVDVSGADVVFNLTTSNLSTEFADATAVPTQARPYGLLVAFTDS